MSEDRGPPNPYTGLNHRGFYEGVYIHVAIKQRVWEDVLVALPSPWTLIFLDFWHDDTCFHPQVKMVVSYQDVVETRYITVPDNGFAPWAGMVGPTLVSYVKEEFA